MDGYRIHSSIKDYIVNNVLSLPKVVVFGKYGVLDIHDSNKYHKEAILRSNTFVNCYENPSFDIRNVLSEGRKRQVEENRKRLVPMQGKIFHFVDDDGELFNTSRVNEVNFRELLRFRIEVGEHLRTTSSKATYISETTQNRFIHFCSEEIISTMITKIKSAKFHSIMFDRTTDISHVSQMSLQGSEVKEDFVGSIDCHTKKYELDPDTMEPVLTGKIMGEIVVSQVKKLNLPFMDCVGICTDGCSVMTSKQNGAVQEAQKMLISAVRCPCLSHALNLSLSESSSVQSVRTAMGVMNDVVSFFTASSKINYVLKHILQGQLHSLRKTRWGERHDSVLQFRVFPPKITQSLEIISSWEERDSSSKA
ncbi:hypothetical protein JTB14_031274 [Gonioctena quinquepunctata]|nr:hypothetical protein JTB14_031274 [Gonioctena quinquepunctata]